MIFPLSVRIFIDATVKTCVAHGRNVLGTRVFLQRHIQ